MKKERIIMVTFIVIFAIILVTLWGLELTSFTVVDPAAAFGGIALFVMIIIGGYVVS